MRNRIKKMVIESLIYLVVSMIFAVTQIKAIMYVVLILQVILTGMSLGKTKEKRNIELFKLLIVSLVLPDNYTVIAVSAFLFFMDGRKLQMKAKYFWVILYIVLNIVVSSVHVGNIIMFIIYVTPFFVLDECICNFACSENIISQCTAYLKKWIFIEMISIITFAGTHIGTVLAYRDLDWVTGTLGTYQCNVLMCICSFSLLIFWSEYNKDKKNLIWIIICGVILLGTGAISYTIVFAIAIIVVSIFSMKEKMSRRVGALALVVVGVILFQFIMPQWITQEMTMLTNRNYVIDRVTKINYYENTFIILPKEEGILKFIFGTGAGQYSSRAAETCAGGYIGLYDRLAKPYETEIRSKYISIRYGGSGLASTSQASVLSLQGEFGIVGLLAFFAFLIDKINKTKGRNARIAVVFFLGLMFFDNTIEFAKYGGIFWMAYYFCTNIDANTGQINITQAKE